MARVLVADDSFYIREILRGALELGGHEVVGEAADGLEAVALFDELRPELTLLDIVLPAHQGLDALAEIKARDPEACVIVCSAHSRKQNVLKAVRNGAVSFLVKPFSTERLLQAVAEALAERGVGTSRRLVPSEVEELLGLAIPARVASVDRAGLPRVTPCWFVWGAGVFYFACGTAQSLQQDIDVNPSLALSIELEEAGRRGPQTRQVLAQGIATVADKSADYWGRRIVAKYLGEKPAGSPARPPRLGERTPGPIFELRPRVLSGICLPPTPAVYREPAPSEPERDGGMPTR